MPITEKLQTDFPSRGKAMQLADIETTAGQLTHVFRHTFADKFMMNEGSILLIQQILGHIAMKVTMRYAHFAPDKLSKANSLNTFNKIYRTKK